MKEFESMRKMISSSPRAPETDMLTVLNTIEASYNGLWRRLKSLQDQVVAGGEMVESYKAMYEQEKKKSLAYLTMVRKMEEVTSAMARNCGTGATTEE
jgi:hypothetical protein